jgi:hypothetical protein
MGPDLEYVPCPAPHQPNRYRNASLFQRSDAFDVNRFGGTVDRSRYLNVLALILRCGLGVL